MMSAIQEGVVNINGTAWTPELEARWLAQPCRVLRQQTSMQPNWRAVFPERQPEESERLGNSQRRM